MVSSLSNSLPPHLTTSYPAPTFLAGETPVKTSRQQAWPREATHHSQAKAQPSRQISGQETLACLGESDEAW